MAILNMEEEITLEEEQERALQEQMDIGKSLDLFQFRWLGNIIIEIGSDPLTYNHLKCNSYCHSNL